MTNPYKRSFSFSGFQANQPAKPLPGPRVDIELDAIADGLANAGASAYDLAVRAGFAGTLAEWLESLRSRLPGPPTEEYPVRGYGFVGDGAYHPLSSRFTTIEAARLIYPRAVSLDDQIDGHAIQKMIDVDKSSSAKGSSIRLPPGQFYLTRRLVVDGDMHLRIDGAGIKATTAVVLNDDRFISAGAVTPLAGTFELNDIRIAAGGGTPATVALEVNSAAVPSMLGSDVQFEGWKTVLNGMNITGSHLTKWRAYYGPGVASETARLTNAYVFRQTRGCFFNVFDAFQTEGYVNAADYLNTSNPGYEGQYWSDLNINSGTSVATIASDVVGYDSPQWYFTGLEIEVSRQWFDLRNISAVTIEIDFALTLGSNSGFSAFNLVSVNGAEITVNQFKSFSFPNYIFNLIADNAGVNLTLGALRVAGGKIQSGLVFFGSGCSQCIENGLTLLIGWDYSVSFASGSTKRTAGNISVHDVKYIASSANMIAAVDVRGPKSTVSLTGSTAGSTTNATGDFVLAWPAGIFQSVPILLPTAGDGSVPIEPIGVLSTTTTGATVRCQGAGSGAARRVNFLAAGS